MASAVTRLTSKLDAKLADKDYYEAHQLYRTIYFRLERDIKNSLPADSVSYFVVVVLPPVHCE